MTKKPLAEINVDLKKKASQSFTLGSETGPQGIQRGCPSPHRPRDLPGRIVRKGAWDTSRGTAQGRTLPPGLRPGATRAELTLMLSVQSARVMASGWLPWDFRGKLGGQAKVSQWVGALRRAPEVQDLGSHRSGA